MEVQLVSLLSGRLKLALLDQNQKPLLMKKHNVNYHWIIAKKKKKKEE